MTRSSGRAFVRAVGARSQQKGKRGRSACTGCARLTHLLHQEDERLLRMEEEIRRLREKLGQDDEEVRKLERELEEWRRGFRARGKRYPERPGQRSGSPKRPGRAAGHPGACRPRPGPEDCDRTVPVAPGVCENCGGEDCRPTGTEVVYPVEGIRFEREEVGYLLQEGLCPCCGHRQFAHLPEELGPRPKIDVPTQALALTLRNEIGLSFGKITALFGFAGLSITKGGLVQMMRRTRQRLLPARVEIQERLRSSPFAHLDETGARHCGRGSYLWLACTSELSFFEHGPGRGAEVIVRILGPDYAGILVVDFYGAYVRYVNELATGGAQLQTCWPHILREARRVAEIEQTHETAEFSRRLHALYERAKEIAARKKPWLTTPGDFLGVWRRFENLATRPDLAISPEVARLQDRMFRFHVPLMRFVETPGLPGSNNQAERDQRPFVIFRSTSFCTRSDEGMKDLSHLLSVSQTLRKQGKTWSGYLP
ncbi:MAG: IS66 family transposase, partial [bacterium]|nr:IS66 family transposase [bacterium]